MSTLLSLPVDIWRCIVPYLLGFDIKNLYSIGQPIISNLLARLVERIDFEWPHGFVDVDGASIWSSRFQNLKELAIRGSFSHTLAKWPFTARSFPSQLTSLSVQFQHAIPALLLDDALATTLIHLKNLEISCKTDVAFKLGALKVPPNLHSLSLDVDSARNTHSLVVGRSDMLALPRSLRSLTLTINASGSYNPQFHEFPALTSLVTCRVPLALSDLPHTLKKLHFSYSTPVDAQNFPFRSYFPALTDLSMSYPVEDFQHVFDPRFLYIEPSLDVLRDKIQSDPQRISMLSGVLGISDLIQNPIDGTNGAYSEYFALYVMRRDRLMPFEQYAPFLRSVKVYHDHEAPSSTLNLLPNATSVKLIEWNIIRPGTPNPIEPLQALPPLKLLSLHSISATQLPSSLETLQCPKLLDIPSLATFPGNLTSLTFFEPVDADIASVLPTSLLHIVLLFAGTPSDKIKMRSDLSPAFAPSDAADANDPKWLTPCDLAWRVIATRLINLKTLTICMRAGCPSTALTPLLSTNLELIRLRKDPQLFGRTINTIPWISTLLDGPKTSHRPSPIPLSVRSMDLQTDDLIPFVALALIPDSITSLTVSPLTKQTTLPNSPYDLQITPSQIMKRLPPNLQNFTCREGNGQSVNIDPSCLDYLPDSLEILSLSSQFCIKRHKSDTWETVAKLLPPRLHHLTLDCAEEEYGKLRHSHVLTKSSLLSKISLK